MKVSTDPHAGKSKRVATLSSTVSATASSTVSWVCLLMSIFPSATWARETRDPCEIAKRRDTLGELLRQIPLKNARKAATKAPPAPKVHNHKVATSAGKKHTKFQCPPGMFVGKASWYGPRFEGRKRADGKIFRTAVPQVAHKTADLGTFAKFYNPEKHLRTQLPITDRGPFVKGRQFDFSLGALLRLGLNPKHGTFDVCYRFED